MVKLEARTTDKDVIISKDSFEHLLNCLDNQKFINEVNADALGSMNTDQIHSVQSETQAAIDDFNRQCRKVCNDPVPRQSNVRRMPREKDARRV